MAEELVKQIPEVNVYFPLHDTGIDLLVVKARRHVSIQVKESRLYQWGNAWHQVSTKKLNVADFLVFVTHVLPSEPSKALVFHRFFLVVSQHELTQRAQRKRSSGDRYHFQFEFREDGKVLDNREDSGDPGADYSQFRDNWQQLRDALN